MRKVEILPNERPNVNEAATAFRAQSPVMPCLEKLSDAPARWVRVVVIHLELG